MEFKENISQKTDSSEKISSVSEPDDFMKGFDCFNSDGSSENSVSEPDDFMKGFDCFNSDGSSENSVSEPDDFMKGFSFFMPDDPPEDIYPLSETESAEPDMVEELIKHITETASREYFITENYIYIKKNALLFLTDRIDREKFKKILSDMKERVIKTRKEHEEAYFLENEWTVETAAGDRLLMEGMKGYEEGLTFLENNSDEKNEESIKSGIDMIYEANKKLVLNQCLVKYVENIISMRDKMFLLKKFLKV